MTTPTGYKKNHLGHLIPVDQISALDQLRDETVHSLASKFSSMQTILKESKEHIMDELYSFLDCSSSEYNVKLSKKGNVTIRSFDGQYKIQLQINTSITFDERLQIAKMLIDECIQRWSQGARGELVALVNDAFQVDKEGNVSTSRILSLRKIKSDDPQWATAMTAIADSIQPSEGKSYLRAYQRVGDDKWQNISLDWAAL